MALAVGCDHGVMAVAGAEVVPVIYDEAGAACRPLPGAALTGRWEISVPVGSILKLQGKFGPQYCL